MRTGDGLLVLAVALSLGGQTAHAAGCDIWVNVTDTDPAGLNVRATPGGPIIGVLKGGEREVHLTGQSGAWAKIDQAVLVRDRTPDANPLFSGTGYVAFSLLGIGRLVPYQDLYAAPQPYARVALKLSSIKGAMPKAEVIGCSAEYVEVRVNGAVAWAHNCNDPRAASCD
ncbi:MAG TPA: SH3 domain-containing protein [Caulobacteraceae bacterium]|jgi:hypothetical protein|nr:SH3 domain-containing protein [Caulobacteraceae bacterium]